MGRDERAEQALRADLMVLLLSLEALRRGGVLTPHQAELAGIALSKARGPMAAVSPPARPAGPLAPGE